ATAGFTLLELVVTLALVALVTALAAPAIASRLLETPAARTARLVRGMAGEGRASAAATGRAMVLVWSVRERAFTLAPVGDEAARGVAAMEARPGTGASGGPRPPRSRTLAVPDEVRVEASGMAPVQGGRWIGGDAAGLLFLPLGGSTGGSVTLTSGSERILVRVDPVTGYASFAEPR
ncbi:MAG: prepilin-type N-terminal cleavage/methylation domain-containing protein, partial [Gemmatimonadota bacterium]